MCISIMPKMLWCWRRSLPSALSILTLVQVLTGSIEDAEHIGQIIVYLRQLLAHNPARSHVYGALTNLHSAALYRCTRHTDKVEFSQAIDLAKGKQRHCILIS